MAMGAGRPPLVPTSLVVAAFQAGLAVLGFDVMRWLLRVVLPLSILSVGVIVGLYLATDDPRYAARSRGRLPRPTCDLDRASRRSSVSCAARRSRSSPTLPTSAATRRRGGTCRSGSSRRRSSAAAVTTFVGGYAAAASGDTNPFVAVSRLTSNDLLLVAPAGSDRRPDTGRQPDERLHGRPLAGQHGAVASGGCGRPFSPATAAVTLSAFPSFIEEAADVGHAPRQHRRAADGGHPGRLSDPETAADRRRRAVRPRWALPLPERDQRRGDRRGRLGRRPLLRALARLVEGSLGRRSRGRLSTSRSSPRWAWPRRGRRRRRRSRGLGGDARRRALQRRPRSGSAGSTKIPVMRTLRRRRALLGAACAVLAAGVAATVVLVFSANSRAEPTRAQYLAQVAAICRVYGPQARQDPATRRRRACERDRRRHPRPPARQGAAARRSGHSRRRRSCASGSRAGSSSRIGESAGSRRRSRAGRRAGFPHDERCLRRLHPRRLRDGSSRERDRHPPPALLTIDRPARRKRRIVDCG